MNTAYCLVNMPDPQACWFLKAFKINGSCGSSIRLLISVKGFFCGGLWLCLYEQHSNNNATKEQSMCEMHKLWWQHWRTFMFPKMYLSEQRRLVQMQQNYELYSELHCAGLNLEWFLLLYSSLTEIRFCLYNQYSRHIDLNLLEINKYCQEQSSCREIDKTTWL